MFFFGPFWKMCKNCYEDNDLHILYLLKFYLKQTLTVTWKKCFFFPNTRLQFIHVHYLSDITTIVSTNF